MKSKDYEEKKQREIDFFISKKKQNRFVKLFHSPLFYDTSRDTYNYIYAKKQMERFIHQHLKEKVVENMLIAPCGCGHDYKYLVKFAKNIYGIDLSQVQIDRCPSQIIAKAGDILQSGYADEQFDFIASPFFFHHVKNFGFDPFLKEFYRILKQGGYIYIMEPSIYNPVYAFTRPMKKIFKNPFGEVEDEGPIRPKMLVDSLKRNNFKNIEVSAATFSHVCFFIPLAKVINWITKPLLNKWLFKNFGWMVSFIARKI